MNNRSLFTDATLNPKLKVGVGGYLIVPESFIKTPSNLIKISELDEILVLKRFEDTSSTKLEVQTENPWLAVRITDALGTAIDKGLIFCPPKIRIF
ncbi:MAG: hypothetical protein JRF62_13080 [Deltaproteobacteria bacterium]|nr:hypothetical protein [Deltaproteobacteria bacterium]